MLEEEPEIEAKRMPLPAIIALYIIFSLCACGVGLGVLNLVGQAGANVNEDSYIAAEGLAYETIYNTTTADHNTVERMQLQQLDENTDRYAILMQYQLEDGAHLALIVAEASAGGFVELPAANEVTIADENLTATARFDPERFDGDAAVYGRILNNAIVRVDVFWPGESAISAEASFFADTFLLFIPWNPIDGSGLPANLIAYDESGAVVTVLTWPRPES